MPSHSLQLLADAIAGVAFALAVAGIVELVIRPDLAARRAAGALATERTEPSEREGADPDGPTDRGVEGGPVREPQWRTTAATVALHVVAGASGVYLSLDVVPFRVVFAGGCWLYLGYVAFGRRPRTPAGG